MSKRKAYLTADFLQNKLNKLGFNCTKHGLSLHIVIFELPNVSMRLVVV